MCYMQSFDPHHQPYLCSYEEVHSGAKCWELSELFFEFRSMWPSQYTVYHQNDDEDELSPLNAMIFW